MFPQGFVDNNRKFPNYKRDFYVERKEIVIRFGGQGYAVLVDGTATIFGSPLKRNIRYEFSMCTVPIVSPLVCRLHVEGDFTATVDGICSQADDIHAVLGLARSAAARRVAPPSQTNSVCDVPENPFKAPSWGPRVLVIGDRDTGKTSLCCTLANMAVASGHYGVSLVDLDVGQQSITCPGSIAAAFIDDFISPEEGFNRTAPLTMFFGSKTFSTSTRQRFLVLCASMARGVASCGLGKPKFAAGGVIVNTAGWIHGLGLDVLIQLLSIFSITHVVVCGSNAQLADTISKAMIGEKAILLNYPRKARIFRRGNDIRDNWRLQQMVNYFGGTKRTPLIPFRGICAVKDVHFLDAVTLNPLTYKDVQPLSLAAVSWADSIEGIDEMNVAGFIVLLEIGESYFSFLSPAGGALPKPFILVSQDIKYPWHCVPALAPP